MNIEICELLNPTKAQKKAGRVGIVMSALEINAPKDYSDFNRNGLHWEEDYVVRNIDSAVGMPFVVRFLDEDKSIISDHGRTENDSEDGDIVFPDSDTVGYVEKAWIDEMEIEGQLRRVLMVKGYLFSQRYHNLVKYLRECIANEESIKGSVEISPKPDTASIVYENDKFNPDGSLHMGRCPMDYDFSGLCILNSFIPPADNASQVLELNNAQSNKVTNKEDTQMGDDKKLLELNEKLVAVTEELNSLKTAMADKDKELNACRDELNACREELNACKKELNTANSKSSELNELLVEANRNLEAQKAIVTELNSEIEPLRTMKKDAEEKKARADIESYYSDIVKHNGFSEAELNMLKTDYVEKLDLEGLKAKESELCVQKFKEMRKSNGVSVELNSDSNNTEDLFFSSKEPEIADDPMDFSGLF